MNKTTIIVTLLLGLLALLLLLALGSSSYLSTKAAGADDCRALCQESCQGFATDEDAELCRSECRTLCAESY